MWLITLLPNWIWLAALMGCVIGYIASKLLVLLPHRLVLEIAAIALACATTFALGYKYCEESWQARVGELEQKIQVAEAKSQQVNATVTQRVATKTQQVQHAAKTNKEVIRETVAPQINTTCTLPVSSIVLHNSASQATMATGTSSVDGTPSGVEASELLSTVVENYSICQENALKVQAWQEWYLQQKQIFESTYQ